MGAEKGKQSRTGPTDIEVALEEWDLQLTNQEHLERDLAMAQSLHRAVRNDRATITLFQQGRHELELIVNRPCESLVWRQALQIFVPAAASIRHWCVSSSDSCDGAARSARSKHQCSRTDGSPSPSASVISPLGLQQCAVLQSKVTQRVETGGAVQPEWYYEN